MSSSTNDSETLPINEIDNTAEIIAYRVEKIFQRYFVTLIVFMFLQSFTETLLEKYL
jgi:hypothetical protein